MSRLALVTRRFPPECCGVGDYTARLAASWQQQGHDVTVFVASPEFQDQKSDVRNQKQQEADTPASEIHVVRIKLDGWGDVRAATRAIREAQPDAVQLEYSNYGWSRFGFSFWMNALVLALRRAGLPVIVALHEFPLEFRHYPLQAGISLLQRLHFALLVLAASDVLTNTLQRVRILRAWFPWWREAIHYRPNSSNILVAACDAQQCAGLRAAHAAGAELVVATFGVYHPGKHYEDVIEGAARAGEKLRVALWLLGDARQAQPAYLEKLQECVRKNQFEAAVWWSGYLAVDEVSTALQTVDIFVLPQPDGHLTRSTAFLAAAAHGLPVIAVRNAENQKEFTQGENVWLVERASAETFAEAIRQLAGDAGLRARLGSNLRALYDKRFAWAVAAAFRGVAMKLTGTVPVTAEGRKS